MVEHSIQHPGDGRGPRRVYVNGNEISNVLWADVAAGVIAYAPQPVRLHRLRDEIYTRKLRGVITVVPMES